jgi:predicted nucleotidyltransferase
VYLFGSRANGTMTRYSDIDVAVLSRQSLPVGLLSTIREQLEDSQIVYKVDLVDLNEVSTEFKEKVINEGILWKD